MPITTRTHNTQYTIHNTQYTIYNAHTRHGAFAKRELPAGTIITGTPLLHFPDKTWFDMYDFVSCNTTGRSGGEGEGDAASSYMVRDLKAGPYSQQLLLNYCFGHPESTLVLCPYGSGGNYINHASSSDSDRSSDRSSDSSTRRTANVKLQWSKNGTTNHNEDWFTKDPTDMMGDHQTRLAMDYVALRTIHEGEELFLDYGSEWEDKWQTLSQQHAAYFTNDNNKNNKENHNALYDYISAREYNRQHGEESVRTTQEQMNDPYPSNLSLRCHHSLHELTDGYNRTIITPLHILVATDPDSADAEADIADGANMETALGAAYATHQQHPLEWKDSLTGDPNGYECHIEKRQVVEIKKAAATATAVGVDDDTATTTATDTSNHNDNPIAPHDVQVEAYTVTFISTQEDEKNNGSTVSKTLTGVLREYIKFVDLPYSK